MLLMLYGGTKVGNLRVMKGNKIEVDDDHSFLNSLTFKK
jgi:hypothetical protein